MWKPESGNVKQPPSDCDPALGAPPWGSSEVGDDDALIRRGNAVALVPLPLFSGVRGLYQPQHLQNQF